MVTLVYDLGTTIEVGWEVYVLVQGNQEQNEINLVDEEIDKITNDVDNLIVDGIAPNNGVDKHRNVVVDVDDDPIVIDI